MERFAVIGTQTNMPEFHTQINKYKSDGGKYIQNCLKLNLELILNGTGTDVSPLNDKL